MNNIEKLQKEKSLLLKKVEEIDLQIEDLKKSQKELEQYPNNLNLKHGKIHKFVTKKYDDKILRNSYDQLGTNYQNVLVSDSLQNEMDNFYFVIISTNEEFSCDEEIISYAILPYTYKNLLSKEEIIYSSINYKFSTPEYFTFDNILNSILAFKRLYIRMHNDGLSQDLVRKIKNYIYNHFCFDETFYIINNFDLKNLQEEINQFTKYCNE